MHVIMEPNKKGKACDVRQHFYTFKVPVCNIPNFPNFRLGTPYDFCNPDIVVVSSTDQVLEPTPQNRKITIYPNPATDKVTVFGHEIHNIRVFSLEGKVMIQIDTDSVSSQEIDMSSLPPAVYSIQTTSGPLHESQTVKCIKIQ
jgi:hypothetical protein